MSNHYLCDTYNDCPDGFDEQNCSTSKTIHRSHTEVVNMLNVG